MPLNIADLTISSPDFAALASIPEELSADGGNRLPRLIVQGVPAGAHELALILHDPDAPLAQGFTHWTVYGIPAADGELDTAAEGVTTGPNGIGTAEYTGPQPPAGHGQHHYYFTVYALDRPVTGTPTREQFLAEYADSIIEQNRLVGSFFR
ncbi:YbhB/YbcL family Raf kinase inhibitor-like protein [Pseudoclavibacter sp. RFBB5]|uniref:YbhB/YbcL family Raf kinase inhibitor-like protein n=1 Tax=Pseudoclavibacter sp. RFBB5 TaxID=2080574 RepID=UPI000CE84B35|nr:YbhB/YbcL family Raf kinase inhibitor-like protein [Pseudoclavibacter sp. RFBB5]PPG31217.1 YbhB/YbcL family Raf kinase inhibitor-like protein [Pseudoclavibacter sp. RFBB5]